MDTEDLQHLRLLGIFHYVVAGLAGLFACFPIIHLVIGIVILAGGFPESKPHDADFGRMIGAFFVGFASIAILAGWAFAICLAFAGRFLQQHRRYTYCLVMAGLACMFMPFGTVLGVLTIIVLSRDRVKALFNGAPSGMAS